MRSVKVLFFTADAPLGRPRGQSLELAEDLRKIKQRVRRARYGDCLVFDPHGAARADDLIDLLEDTDAQIVHFSGHGGSRGLEFVARGGQDRQPVDAAALKRLFRDCNGSVRLVVLSACSSREEAQAVAEVVGCAIGTLNLIGDDAAIDFNSRFYAAIASGHSVYRAHEKACTALQVHGIPEAEYPRIFVRDQRADARDLVFFRTLRLVPVRIAAALAACAITAAAVVWPRTVHPELTPSDIACGSESTTQGIRTLTDTQGAVSATPATPAGPAERVATAKAFYRARNYAAAATAFEQAAADGNGEAMGCLGYMYLVGRGVDSVPTTGVSLLRRAATNERDAHAMYALAHAYLTGNGVNQSDYYATDWLKKAAEEKEYAEAMRSLGWIYQAKMNDSSSQQALMWFRRAVDARSVDALVDLGQMYQSGQGVPRDAAEAFRLYQSAARSNSRLGMLAVGQSYQNAVGVARDYTQAMEWYRRAMKAGSADAMNSIGILYENGLGVRKSYAKAVRWYRRATKAGSEAGAVNLGRFGQD